jgi:hypothetical protein
MEDIKKREEVFEKLGLFYLGKEVDIDSGEMEEAMLLVKNKNLTTHAAIIGMTGSGKTGLGIALIEEASLDKIPSIIIDPKGDMGNLLLAFDDFDPKKFQPWIDPIEAQKKSLSVEELAQKTALMWEKGINSFSQDRDRVKRFKESADFTIYTPGSLSGVPLSVLSNFDAPSTDTVDDPDTFNYLLNSTVSSILSLIGINADPLKSKEHLLLSSIFKHFWKKGISLDLEKLIGQITDPPFKKIGVLPLGSFYPQNERLKLAMLLNNVLASPTFSAWIEGEELDISKLLYTKEGKPKVSILSIAHLNDNERMFFVTLFLNRYISWMRSQSGSTSLRTLLYMDEIYGFFPSTSNPPSKSPMLLLLKQARAYGVGVVLSTQNPIDLDYKGLSNIGSWFIGRLQTRQDIDRVIDGLLKSGEGSLDKKSIISLLSNLKKRTFLFKSAHRESIDLFGTRWVMSYLKGPLTKDEISKLMHKKREAILSSKEDIKESGEEEKRSDLTTKPILSEEIDEFFYQANPSSNLYHPYLLANATVKFYDSKRGIDQEEEVYLKYRLTVNQKDIDWEEGEINEDDFDLYDIEPTIESSFDPLPEFITKLKNLNSLQKEFSDYLYHSKKLTLYRYPKLKLESDVKESLEEFNQRAMQFLREKKEEKIEKITEKFEKKRASLEKRLNRALEKLDKEEADVEASKTNALLSFGMTILDALTGRSTFKRSTTAKAGATLRSAGRMYREKDDVERAKERVSEIEDEIYKLESELEEAIMEMDEEFLIENFEVEEFFIRPRRSDIVDIESAILWESE